MLKIVILLIILVILCLSKEEGYRLILKDVTRQLKDNRICTDVDVYEFRGETLGPNVLWTAGIHGNEPAGTVAAYKMIHEIQEGKIKIIKGGLIIIPTVNPCGIYRYERYDNKGNDLNRNYIETTDIINNRIVIEQMKKADFIIDSHEGYAYYKNTGTLLQPILSMGSTLTPGHTLLSKRIATYCIEELNKKIKDEYKKYEIYPDDNIIGTLRDYANKYKKHYILIESSGQNEIQNIVLRRDQHLTVVLTTLRNLNML